MWGAADQSQDYKRRWTESRTFLFILVLVIVYVLSITSNVEERPRLQLHREKFNLTDRYNIQGEVGTNTFYRRDYHTNFQNRDKRSSFS